MPVRQIHAWKPLAAFCTALLFPLVTASAAEGEATSFQPVAKDQSGLVFAPAGVEAEAVDKGRVRYRYKRRMHRRLHRHSISHPHNRRVPVSRLEKALTQGTEVRVPRRRARHGKLTVHTAPISKTACDWGAFGADAAPGSCWRPYSEQSPFNKSLPANVQQVSNSAAIGNRTATFGSGAPMFKGGVADTTSDFGHSLYYSSPSDPVYTVDCVKSWGTCDVEGMQVRIPAKAKPTGGGDGHMGVIDQQNGVEYDFWQVLDKPAGGGTLKVSWGGKTAIGTPDATGLGSKAVAAGYGLAAGVIRPEELAAGEINHALFMTVKCTNGTSVYPAGKNTGRVCSELGLSDADAPPMGAHFYLEMTQAQIDGLKAPAWQKAILRAMVTHGMFVGDTGASANGWTLKVQSGTSYTSLGFADPWVELGKENGLPTVTGSDGSADYLFDLRKTLDWKSKLRVAQPCVAQGSC